MFRFWYRFVPANRSIISRGAKDLAYKRIEPFLTGYMGAVFEDICKQYLWGELLCGNSPIEFSDLGRWWGNNSKTKSQEEIDIIGFDDGAGALFAECKWTNEKADLLVLQTLMNRSEVFKCKEKHYYLFAKTGFTKGCVEFASEHDGVILVSFDDMMKRFRK